MLRIGLLNGLDFMDISVGEHKKMIIVLVIIEVRKEGKKKRKRYLKDRVEKGSLKIIHLPLLWII